MTAPAHDAAAIAEIAKGLTKAQRALIDTLGDGIALAEHVDIDLARQLYAVGVTCVIDAADLRFVGLTKFGRELRAHISQAKGE